MTIDVNTTIFCCPNCLGELSETSCLKCHTSYQQTLGILDLRWPRPVSVSKQETIQIELMKNNYLTSTFSELVALRFRRSNLPNDIVSHYQRYAADPRERSRQMIDLFERKAKEIYGSFRTRIALDLGCGVGASSSVLSTKFDYVVGVDVDIISLILARKFLEERNITNVALVQAYAQKLPLPEAAIDYAIAQNVLEHLFNVEKALTEVRRVLSNGGIFCGDSRNRYDIFFPEPHTKLHWVGFWPRRWQAWYVWQFRKMEYDHTCLLSFPELKKYAVRTFGSNAHIVLPGGGAYGRSAKWDSVIRLFERVSISKWLLACFYPSLLLVARATSHE